MDRTFDRPLHMLFHRRRTIPTASNRNQPIIKFQHYTAYFGTPPPTTTAYSRDSAIPHPIGRITIGECRSVSEYAILASGIKGGSFWWRFACASCSLFRNLSTVQKIAQHEERIHQMKITSVKVHDSCSSPFTHPPVGSPMA